MTMTARGQLGLRVPGIVLGSHLTGESAFVARVVI